MSVADRTKGSAAAAKTARNLKGILARLSQDIPAAGDQLETFGVVGPTVSFCPDRSHSRSARAIPLYAVSGRLAYARPVVYYRRFDDFIQGVSFDATPGVVNTPVEMVAQASGDATPLRFANTDAEIWGVDIAIGAKIAGPLRIDGVASYVRGKRRDVADNLYRMAPANGRLALAWETARWSLSVEGLVVAPQKKVSATNGEATSKGYILANLYGHWLVRDGMRLDFGVENLFDRHYLEHLSGYNRIVGSDVPLGARLPGAGRSAFVRFRWALN